MIYNGYSQAELDALLQLLEELKIPHALGADENLMQQTTQGDRGQRRGALNASYMRLEIEDDELKKIAPQHYQALEKFHIYPQYVDIPEGLGEDAPSEPKPPRPATKSGRLIQVVMVVITAMMLYAALKGRG